MLYEQRQTCSDAVILAELATLPVLPDEDDPIWENDQTWNDLMDPFLAFAELARHRRLRAAIPLLLERASYGDPGETMRGLRHTLEAIVQPEWDVLTDMCMDTASRPQAGARLWSIQELGVLRDARSMDTVIRALDDPARDVRVKACHSLTRICQTQPSCRIAALKALSVYCNKRDDPYEQRIGNKASASISDMQ